MSTEPAPSVLDQPRRQRQPNRTPGSGVPAVVQASFLLWLTAIAAGMFETVLVVIDRASEDLDTGVLFGVGSRLVIFAVFLRVIARLRQGSNRARTALAVLLGGFGTLSLVVGPIGWVAQGNSITDALAEAGALSLLFGASRVIHVAAVWVAIVLMYRPAANRYFRTGAR